MDMEVEAIYENIQFKNRNPAGRQTRRQNPTEAQNSRRRWFVMITACLGIFCVVLVIALILLYIHLTAERDQMKMTHMNIAKEHNETLNSLKVNYSRLTDETEEREKYFNSVILELETRVDHLRYELMKNLSGSCTYFISNEKKTWSDSRQFCRDRGGDLIIINTEKKQRFISSLVKDRVWIGLSDIEKEGNMKWVDNKPLNKGFWYQGEPNDQNGNEDCVEILILSTQTIMNWNDLSCSHMRKWICEYLF